MAAPSETRNRVLVVEDEPDIRAMIGMVLDARELPHEDVGDGVAALDRMTRKPYGSVLLDLMMPGMDGFAVLGAIRARRPELLHRIIVLTGGTPDLIARVDKSVFRVLRKPVVLGELMNTVRCCLEQGSG